MATPKKKKIDPRNRLAKGRQFNENRSKALALILACPSCHGRVSPLPVGCDELVYVPEFQCNCGVKFAILNPSTIDGGIVQDGDKVPVEAIKPAIDWMKELGMKIIDWDGFENRDPSVKMTKEEFLRRSIHATQMLPCLPPVEAKPPAKMNRDQWNSMIARNEYSRDCPECTAEALMVTRITAGYALECQACFQSYEHTGPTRTSKYIKASVGSAEVTYTPASANNETATTGAKRASMYPKGKDFEARYDLMFRNAAGMRRLAETWGEGFRKYGPDNWMKGFPESVFISHAMEHIRLYLAGDKSEDHLAHTAWNMLALCWVEENKPELLDLTKPEQKA